MAGGRQPKSMDLNVLAEVGAIFEIVWINILLSADNAILVALACRNLPEKQKRLGIVLGAGGAIALRIAFTTAVAKLLDVPFLTMIGGLFVIFLAAKLPHQESQPPQVAANRTLFKAVASIIVADVMVSLDNAFALAAAANGSTALIIFGLLLSAPTIMFSAGLLASLLTRLPALIWLGVGILGWAGGQLVARDPALNNLPLSETWIGALGCAAVLLWAALSTRLRKDHGVTVRPP
jgi:YjbE family integral membrane protein